MAAMVVVLSLHRCAFFQRGGAFQSDVTMLKCTTDYRGFSTYVVIDSNTCQTWRGM